MGSLILAVLVAALTAPPDDATATAVGSGIHDDTSPAITLDGRWTEKNSAHARGGSYGVLNSSGGASITFTGTGVSWISRRNAYAGQADVYIDGVKKKRVDLYAPTTRYEQVSYEIRGLRSGTHRFRIVRTGTKNRASGGRNIMLDAINVLDTRPPAAPPAPSTSGTRTGARLTWLGGEADVVAYRVHRRAGTGPAELIGTAAAPVTTFHDIGLHAGSAYRYTVTAVDSSGNVSRPSPTATFAMVAATSDPDPDPTTCPAPTVTVTDRAGLLAALADATPGTAIRLAPGRYPGPIRVTVTGTADRPVSICGPRDAVIDTGDVTRSGGIRIDRSSHLVVAGVTVRNSQKGVTVIAGDHVVLTGLRVEQIGEEAIHLRGNTVDSAVLHNSIAHTGLMTPMYGEGVYVGMAKGNWCAYNDCQPDRSDRNRIIGNDISATTADQIEAKEGAVDGIIADNVLDGTGMIARYADSLVNIQSNGWVITGNTGRDAPLDGVQVWAAFPGYGRDNIAWANRFAGSVPGYAVRLAYAPLENYVGCDTVAASDSLGIANKPCQR